MKITFVAQVADLSGGCRVIATHANHLKARGHEVTVVASKWPTPSLQKRMAARLLGRWLPPPQPEKTHFDSLEGEFRLLKHSGSVTNSDLPDADVVIATWWETAIAVSKLHPSKGRKFYFVQHHEVYDYLPKQLAAETYRLPLKKITISQWLVDVMRDVYGDTDVKYVPNSVDTDKFFAPARKKREHPTIGILYSPVHFKGLDVGFEAIENTRRLVPNLRVVSFGARPPVPRLPLPEGTTFHLAPEQSKLREIYAQCDVFLMCSRTEGFGLPVLEAMACRTPVVATRTGCAPDIITDGQNGFVVDVEDSAALGEKLAEVLIMAEDAWQSMSQASLRTVSRYSWTDAAALFEEALLKEL